MKKSLLFLLGSLVAGAGLVGGTFAAWAVTDNADPFSVNITPGTLDVGTDKAVTLEWGTRGLIDIEQIGMGDEKGPYTLGLKATTNDNSDFTGSLTVALETEATGAQKLIDYLHVNVYGAADKTGGAILTVPDGSANYTVSEDIVVTSGTEKLVYFFVSLDNTMTPVVYNAIKNDVVTLTVDWNKGSAIVPVTSRTIYYQNSGWTNVYAYAWDTSDGSMNAAWPGIAMNHIRGDYYSTALDVKFDKIIFNDGSSNQSADLDISTNAATPMWNGTAWVAAPDLSAASVYYFVGGPTDWQVDANYLFVELQTPVEKSGHTYTHILENVEIAANTYWKVIDPTTNTWYGENGHTGSEDNFHIGQLNHYNFYFNPDATPHIFCEAIVNP